MYVTKQKNTDIEAARDRPENVGVTQIEVTPAMVMAGVSALEAYRDAFADPQLVAAVYTAMALEASPEAPEKNP
jgi:hypothetical protein